MRLVRAAGQNVSPSDDGRLYDQIFSDGLFTETSFASLGADSVRIGAMYGDLCGRDFTIEQQTITVQLPEGEGETTGYIYVEIDLSAETPLSVGSALAPFTPTYEDINVNGAVCQMIVAEYTATALAVTSVTAVYERAAASSVKAGSIATVENTTATEAHDVGEYVLINGQMYIVTAAVSIGETFIEGTNISAVSIGDELTALNAGLSTVGKPVLIGTSENNPPLSWSNFNLSEPISNFSYLIIVLKRNTNQDLASVTLPVDDLTTSESWVAIYVTSNWRFSMKYAKVSDTVMKAATDERAGFDGFLKVYGVR